MAAQPALPNVFVPIRRQLAFDDLGAIGRGASAARSVLAENGQLYLIKGPTLTPQFPYVAANELIATELAGLLGLPILDCCVIEMAGTLYFGSTWMPPGTFDPALTEAAFQQCDNRERAYDVTVFDAWVYNIDRHQENLVVRRIPGKDGAPERLLLLLNDHSHCVVPPPNTPASLAAKIGEPLQSCVRSELHFVRNSIVDLHKLSRALDTIERLSDDLIRAVVQSVPEPLLSVEDGLRIAAFLIQRKACLRQVLRDGRHLLPRLEGGHL